MKIIPQAAIILINPTSPPPLSQKGQALLYFDQAKSTLMMSTNGQPFEELMKKTKVIQTQNYTISNKQLVQSTHPEQMAALHIDETIEAVFATTGISDAELHIELKVGPDILAHHIHTEQSTQTTTINISKNSLLELYAFNSVDSATSVFWSSTLKSSLEYEV